MTRERARVSPLKRLCRSWDVIGFAVGAVCDRRDVEISTPRASHRPPRQFLRPQNFPRDHEPLDFARSFADRAEFNVPVEFFGRIFLDKSITSVDLDAF